MIIIKDKIKSWRAEKGTQERRSFQRLQTELSLLYQPVAGKEAIIKNAVSVDIGGGGLKFIAKDDTSVGRFLQLSIQLPNEKDKPVETLGTIAWKRKREKDFEIGIEFISIPAQAQRRIIDYINAKNQSKTLTMEDGMNRTEGSTNIKSCCAGEKNGCLINRKLQIRSAITIGVASLIISSFFSLLLWGTYYYFQLSAELLMAETSLPIGAKPLLWQLQNYIAKASAAASIASKEASGILLLSLLAGIIYAAGVAYLELIRMHRIAGPAHSLCKYMQLAKKGEYSVRIIARKNEPFKETSDAFNELMETLEKRKGMAGIPADKSI